MNGESVRVIACCGGMVLVSGLERMSFEVLRVLRSSGVSVHCILNRWENYRIRELAESIGATWSTGYYWYRLERRIRNPMRFLQLSWDVLMTSLGLLRDAYRLRATHVFVPEYVSAIRNGPALLVLRALGVRVILRVANAPERGRFYRIVWGWIVPPLVTRIVANSEFGMTRCLEMKIDRKKLELIRNCVSHRDVPSGTDVDVVSLVKRAKTILCIGQIAPFKGTHLAVEAALFLLERGEDVQLVVVGNEPTWPPELARYYEELRDRAARHPGGGRVRFVGSRTDVLEIMSGGFVLLAPILQEETFGNVVLEARSVGLPVVAFARGGLPELVEHGVTGYLCRSEDREGLVEGIEFFLRSPDTWRHAREVSMQSFEDPESPYTPCSFERAWRRVFAIEAGPST